MIMTEIKYIQIQDPEKGKCKVFSSVPEMGWKYKKQKMWIPVWFSIICIAKWGHVSYHLTEYKFTEKNYYVQKNLPQTFGELQVKIDNTWGD